MTDKLRLDLFMTTDLLDAINRWRSKQLDLPPRAEAVRRLVEIALQAEGVRVAGKPVRRQKTVAA